MSRKVFSTFFTLILLIVIAVPGLDAWPGVDVVDESAKISASASTLQHAPTGNILKKYRREGGQWVYVRTIDAEWFCRVRMQVKFTGYGNASIGAEGQTVKRETGSTFKTLSPDAGTTRISSYLFFDQSEPLELFASATGTVKTKNENKVGGYKVTGKGYYEIGHGGDGIGLSVYNVAGSLTLGGIDSETMSMPLDEVDQPHFDIAIQCDPAEACSGNSSPPPTGSAPPSDSTPPPPTPSDDTPNCQDCTSHCSSPCSCSNSGTCNGTVSTPPPPSYHACGVHETSVSGDHSVQASCSSTDEHGNYCTGSGFYACEAHTHVYPPPPPPTVRCGRSACTASVSSSTEHKSSPCSASAGHTYYTCNPNVNVSNWLNKHRVRTCRYSECGRSWQQCVTGTTPVCNKPFRQQNGLKCWAIE